ncbi:MULTISPECIES: glutamine-hydrolyzing carbamoyl-phosphate synthase small subunit [unclassified Campylobacter]|uniref:glutamine-hydrolyzing carbamoyl-phosphate synthase small subunit n=1 Tax=unclassified Campylobacter TaxID=2593542 RepID=UPI001237BA36|nr:MULTISPECIES: glutamine-hydrolyzing carbamoyl-phosphate synthase small subunit [unclassified Campylobacter]KAA6224594.1 glutamine-hydrolyzing carbamoyl-phosphate synthase small subunit [Campylobacter sp. LR185c]KAA6224836.1 glutamine-hydrolyzing carbamoyl-phosphate synthase small subunit [Campylobacter sp. LR286c]KAA6227983.1 glutamine-hydrolyzing carbamoyl-phosphate synthase small subunit [Campylobacter sp. LR196d]KAA6233464.1 glutamine-hydrolyzing carbamoyl-phosphate synthase small subunit
MKAVLYLENGLYLEASAFGKGGTFVAELVFNTSMTGYQEIISDPSYAGQFIVFSMPELGVVGTNKDDNESAEIFASGIILRQLSSFYSNFRAQQSLSDYLAKQGKIGICNVDTRYLVKLIRDFGNLRAIISTEIFDKDELKEKLNSSKRIEETNLVEEVSTKQTYTHNQGIWNGKAYNLAKKSGKKIAVIDYGVKKNILNELVEAGFELEIYPFNTKAEVFIDLFNKGELCGVFLSNGPGEPKILQNEIEQIKKLAKAKIPMLGICLGHQLLSNAFGYETYKMKFGQHGANHPVINLENKRVEITAQNHNYNVPENLSEVAFITHRNLFGDNVEGVRYKDYPIISVQHHPESSSGPHESRYIFKEFMKLV